MKVSTKFEFLFVLGIQTFKLNLFSFFSGFKLYVPRQIGSCLHINKMMKQCVLCSLSVWINTCNFRVAEHSFGARFSLSMMMQCSARARNKHGADFIYLTLFCSL